MTNLICCPRCGGEPKQTATKFGLRLDCCGLWAWGYNQLVDAETHDARKAAHAAFDPIWQSGLMGRGEAYRTLAKAMGLSSEDCHMKKMTADQALAVVEIAEKMKSAFRSR